MPARHRSTECERMESLSDGECCRKQHLTIAEPALRTEVPLRRARLGPTDFRPSGLLTRLPRPQATPLLSAGTTSLLLMLTTPDADPLVGFASRCLRTCVARIAPTEPLNETEP